MLLALTTILVLSLGPDEANPESVATQEAGAAGAADVTHSMTPEAPSGEGQTAGTMQVRENGSSEPSLLSSANDGPPVPTAENESETHIVDAQIDLPSYRAASDRSGPAPFLSTPENEMMPPPGLDGEWPLASFLTARVPGVWQDSGPVAAPGHLDPPEPGALDDIPGAESPRDGGDPPSPGDSAPAFGAPGGDEEQSSPSDPPRDGLLPTFGAPDFPLEPINPVPVPEPGTLLLVGGGAAAAMLRRWRARR